ncbi:MAG: hypothetical protein COA58_15790 [Bacteroidetes bacterium]|nr:MAG: hypothetical protein COA58_15790 [Bacteroidota bacterium]
MLSEFLSFFKNFNFITSDDIKALYGIARIKKFKQDEHIIREGQAFPYVILVLKGLLRNYMISSSGDEKTLKFTNEKNPTGVPECLFLDLPSPEFIQALEDSTVILIDERKFRTLSKSRPRLLQLKIHNMSKGVCEMANRVRFYTMLSPEERYLDLLKTDKSIIERVEDRHLASYIGVTPVSYSRIKNRTKS